MAGKVTDSANSMFASIGAVQTLVENFPMNLISFKNNIILIIFTKITIKFCEIKD
jgi:hypothetical protein